MILFLSLRRSSRSAYALLVAGALAVCVWRYFVWHAGGTPFDIQQRTDCRADSLLIGALAGQLYVRRSLPHLRFSRLAWPALALLAFCVFFLPTRNSFWYVGGYTLVAIAAAVIVLALVQGDWGGSGLFRFSPFRSLGVVSYGAYLWHLPVFLAVVRALPKAASGIQFIIAVAIIAACTAFSWLAIERPCQRMRHGTRRDVAQRGTMPPEEQRL